jgi:hypothetical protein
MTFVNLETAVSGYAPQVTSRWNQVDAGCVMGV